MQCQFKAFPFLTFSNSLAFNYLAALFNLVASFINWVASFNLAQPFIGLDTQANFNISLIIEVIDTFLYIKLFLNILLRVINSFI